MSTERIYRIVDHTKGEGMLYSLEQLEHLKNNRMINADTVIKREGDDHTFPAGALFDFSAHEDPTKPDADVNLLGIISVILIFFFPLAGLVTSIIGLVIANKRKQNRNLVMTALIINGFLVFVAFLVLALGFAIASGADGLHWFFKDFAPRAKWI